MLQAYDEFLQEKRCAKTKKEPTEEEMDKETDARVDAALDDDGTSVSYMGMLKLCRQIAFFLKDGEQTKERVSGGIEPFVMENDDAVSTLHSVIDQARELTGERPDLVEGE
jgi:hypothetical protein